MKFGACVQVKRHAMNIIKSWLVSVVHNQIS